MSDTTAEKSPNATPQHATKREERLYELLRAVRKYAGIPTPTNVSDHELSDTCLHVQRIAVECRELREMREGLSTMMEESCAEAEKLAAATRADRDAMQAAMIVLRLRLEAGTPT